MYNGTCIYLCKKLRTAYYNPCNWTDPKKECPENVGLILYDVGGKAQISEHEEPKYTLNSMYIVVLFIFCKIQNNYRIQRLSLCLEFIPMCYFLSNFEKPWR